MSRIDLVSKNLLANCFRKSNKDIFLLAKSTRDRYRKNRKNNKSNKNQDLEKEEAKKGTEMSLNVAKNANIFVHNS